MTTVFDTVVAVVVIVGGLCVCSFLIGFLLDFFENKTTHKQNQYVEGRRFAVKRYQEHGVSEASHDDLGNFVDTARTFSDYSSFDQGIEDVIQEKRHGQG